MSTVECYDCHQQVRDLKQHRSVCSAPKKGGKGQKGAGAGGGGRGNRAHSGNRSGGVECFACNQIIQGDLKEHKKVCSNPLAAGQKKHVAHAVEAADVNDESSAPPDYDDVADDAKQPAAEAQEDDDVDDDSKSAASSSSRGRNRKGNSKSKDVYLLFDLSGSMAGSGVGAVKTVAETVHERLHDKDRIAIISFDSAPFWRLKPRPNGQVKRQGELAGILNRIKAQGSTALYDAIWMAVTQLRDKEQKTQVVVITDGEDNASSHTLQQVLDLIAEYPAVSLNIVHIGHSSVAAFVSLANSRGEYAMVGMENVVEKAVELVFKE